jgi:NagD protein
MVGDRLYTDMAMARAANVTGILVLTGDTTANQAATHDEQPDLVVEDLGVLENLLRQCPGAGQG